MIHRGRKLVVEGEPYTWRLSDKGGWYQGMSGEYASFTAQHSGAHGALLRVRLHSLKWTDKCAWDDYYAAQHKCSFTPEDAAYLIEKAVEAGWDPKKKGPEDLGRVGLLLADYRTC